MTDLSISRITHEMNCVMRKSICLYVGLVMAQISLHYLSARSFHSPDTHNFNYTVQTLRLTNTFVFV